MYFTLTDDRSKMPQHFKNINHFMTIFWNQHEQCIQIRTNMPNVGLIRDINVAFQTFERAHILLFSKTNVRLKS